MVAQVQALEREPAQEPVEEPEPAEELAAVQGLALVQVVVLALELVLAQVQERVQALERAQELVPAQAQELVLAGDFLGPRLPGEGRATCREDQRPTRQVVLPTLVHVAMEPKVDVAA